MLRACVVCLPAASVVDPQIGGPVGGTETRAWLFARHLARREDVAVTFVVRHHRPLPETVHGVDVKTVVDRVYRLFEQVGLCVTRIPGFPWLRLKQWRWNLLWRFPAAVVLRCLAPRVDHTAPSDRFQSIEADVFCTFGVQSTSATVIASAHAAGKRAVLVLGSDGDLDEKSLTDPDYVNPYGDRGSVCLFILEQADAIVCQTPEQQVALRERFGREGVVIANPLDLEDWDRRGGNQPSAMPRPVLWIGRAESIHKRPMLCVEIARRCPDLEFVMVMNPRDPAEEARVRDAAPPNVEIREVVSPDDMPALVADSMALLNTSSLEGFPNTFLQAGASRIPVVSLAVGEQYLKASGSGVCCFDNLNLAAESLRQYGSNGDERTAAGQRGRRWVEVHHDAEARTAELAAVLQREADRPQAGEG